MAQSMMTSVAEPLISVRIICIANRSISTRYVTARTAIAGVLPLLPGLDPGLPGGLGRGPNDYCPAPHLHPGDTGQSLLS